MGRGHSKIINVHPPGPSLDERRRNASEKSELMRAKLFQHNESIQRSQELENKNWERQQESFAQQQLQLGEWLTGAAASADTKRQELIRDFDSQIASYDRRLPEAEAQLEELLRRETELEKEITTDSERVDFRKRLYDKQHARFMDRAKEIEDSEQSAIKSIEDTIEQGLGIRTTNASTHKICLELCMHLHALPQRSVQGLQSSQATAVMLQQLAQFLIDQIAIMRDCALKPHLGSPQAAVKALLQETEPGFLEMLPRAQKSPMFNTTRLINADWSSFDVQSNGDKMDLDDALARQRLRDQENVVNFRTAFAQFKSSLSPILPWIEAVSELDKQLHAIQSDPTKFLA